MATHDVPGANPANGDKLAMGSWAEHEDGSLMFVESTENDNVVYSLFDLTKDPVIEYRDMMPIGDFEVAFSCTRDDIHKTVKVDKSRKLKKEQWTWHDKTPFDWNRVIKAGASQGTRYASAHGVLTAAERIAQDLHLRGSKVFTEQVSHRAEQTRGRSLTTRLRRAFDEIFGENA